MDRSNKRTKSRQKLGTEISTQTQPGKTLNFLTDTGTWQAIGANVHTRTHTYTFVFVNNENQTGIRKNKYQKTIGEVSIELLEKSQCPSNFKID